MSEQCDHGNVESERAFDGHCGVCTLAALERLNAEAAQHMEQAMLNGAQCARLRAALKQLYHEACEAGFLTARDYNWPRAMADAREALEHAHE